MLSRLYWRADPFSEIAFEHSESERGKLNSAYEPFL
jgi:hypothetical protein